MKHIEYYYQLSPRINMQVLLSKIKTFILECLFNTIKTFILDCLEKIKNKYYENPMLFILYSILFLAIIAIGIFAPVIYFTGFGFIGVTYETWDTGNSPSYNNNNNNGGGSGDSNADEEKNKTIDLLERIAFKNQNALNDKFAHGNQMYDVSDQQARNLANAQSLQNKRNIGDDWFTQTKKLQGTANQLKGAAGDSLQGSNLYQMWDLLNSAQGDINAESLNTQRKNQDTINNDLFEVLSQNNNARNELANDTEYGHRQIASDFLAQAGSIDVDKANEKFDAWNAAGDNFFNGNLRGAINPEQTQFFYEDNAQEKANTLTSPTTASAASANGDYWNRLIQGYNKRR